MAKFSHHIFICSNRREAGHSRGCCDPQGSGALRARFKSVVQQRGLRPLVRVNMAGCLDQCEFGPVVVIYPQAIWYGGVTVDDVERIVDRTIIAGEVLDDLRIEDHLLNSKGVAVVPPAADISTEQNSCES